MSHINASNDMDLIEFQLIKLSFEIWTWEDWSNHPLEKKINQTETLSSQNTVYQIIQK